MSAASKNVRKDPAYLRLEYLPEGKTIWVLFDMSNGHKATRRYLWWFDTRKAAREHRASQASMPNKARLSVVVKVVVAHVEHRG